MSVLSNLGSDNKKIDQELEFTTYCEKCEFSSWCSRKGRQFDLQSTIEAKFLYMAMRKKTFSLDLLKLPNKSYELANIVDNLVSNYK